MSDMASCDGDEHPEGVLPHRAGQSGGGVEGQAPPAPTSRISVKRAVEVIQSFDDYKRWLVTEIGFGGTKILKFWADDVHKVFGIPCGHRNVRGRDGFINPEAIQYIKNTLGMDKTGAHSLEAAEQFLLRDISESSSKLEKDCFQIAFVIFVMGHVLAPTTKHDYGTIEYWGALADTESISQFNWCEYVLECLMEAVRRLKNDMMAGNMSTNLVGCHLW